MHVEASLPVTYEEVWHIQLIISEAVSMPIRQSPGIRSDALHFLQSLNDLQYSEYKVFPEQSHCKNQKTCSELPASRQEKMVLALKTVLELS